MKEIQSNIIVDEFFDADGNLIPNEDQDLELLEK